LAEETLQGIALKRLGLGQRSDHDLEQRMVGPHDVARPLGGRGHDGPGFGVEDGQGRL